MKELTTKKTVHILVCEGIIRAVVFNATYKLIKGGPSAYNDPRYNTHAFTYPWFDGDHYIATGRWSTPAADAGLGMIFFFRKTWEW